MAGIAKYRRAWFTLLKELGISEEERHEVQERLTGKASTKQWDEHDWDVAVAQLQRWAGNHEDVHAHIKSDRPHGVAKGGQATGSSPLSDGWASENQCRLIEEMCDEIAWRRGREAGPVAYVMAHFLSGDEKALRRSQIQARLDEFQYPCPDVWGCLTRREASDLLTALHKMKGHYPVGQGAEAPCLVQNDGGTT